MEIIVGFYTFITKLHFIELKENLRKEGVKFAYFREAFDYLLIDSKKGKVKITQDGLVYIRSKGTLKDVDSLFVWLKENVFKYLEEVVDENHAFFMKLILKTKPSVILINPAEKTEKIYETFKRKLDYSLKTPKLHKTYGEGLIVFNKVKYSQQQLADLIEYQLIFSEYQNLVRYLLNYNRNIMDEMTELRHKESIRFRELPKTINHLIDKRRETNILLKKITQLDDFLSQRGDLCPIKNVLKQVHLNEFSEMVRLNNYLRDDFQLSKGYISSTVELTDFTLRENEQRELNILQVIFAIGTIAAIVSLGAMPGARLFFRIIGDTVVGEMVSFNLKDLMFWTIISVVIGLILFVIMNFIFQYTKRLRIVKLVKKKT